MASIVLVIAPILAPISNALQETGVFEMQSDRNVAIILVSGWSTGMFPAVPLENSSQKVLPPNTLQVAGCDSITIGKDIFVLLATVPVVSSSSLCQHE